MKKDVEEKKKKGCDRMEEKKKILVVDDSAFMRRVISDIINSDPRCEAVGVAANGAEALELVKKLKPDAISLDIQMPVMDGLTMLRKLNSENPTPVVMMSTLTREGAKETIEALELGAFDFVAKPDNIFKVNSSEIREELIEKICLATQAGSKKVTKFKPSITRTKPLEVHVEKGSKTSNKITKLVAIGTSTGGPRALQYVLPYLPGDLDAGIVVVQHMPPGFTKSLSDRLNQLSEIQVKEAEDNDPIMSGCAYIAPGDKHLTVLEKPDGSLFIRLTDEPPFGGHKPAVDVMMNSIAKIKMSKIIGVIMTGMGSDGAKGLEALKQAKGIHIIAQNEESCVVYGMPKSVVERGIANEIVSLDRISDSITKKLGVL